MIETPPKTTLEERGYTFLKYRDDSQIMSIVQAIIEKYEYWAEVKYTKLPPETTIHELWAYIKWERTMRSIPTWEKYGIHTVITNKMQQMCHEFDMNFGGSWGMSSVIPSQNTEAYLINSLMEEAISSSQIEGASTTRKIAKDMLRKNISPKDKSQQMIFNNYQTIRFIAEHKNEPLTPALLLHIHELMTQKTLDDPEDSGQFRPNNDVVVENAITHEVVHTPPDFHEIPQFVEDLCDFFNRTSSKVFIHPIIRGIVVHFIVAYVHPFADGNGRTARSLFYWYMLKQGYWLTEYLSISRIIAKSKIAYEKAYLYAEADENDMGYFIQYHLKVLDLAFKDMQKYLKRKIEEKQAATTFLRIGNINERQAEILKLIYDEPKAILTVKELQNRFSITPTTAKSDLVGLMKMELLSELALNKKKNGYIKGAKFDEIVRRIS